MPSSPFIFGILGVYIQIISYLNTRVSLRPAPPFQEVPASNCLLVDFDTKAFAYMFRLGGSYSLSWSEFSVLSFLYWIFEMLHNIYSWMVVIYDAFRNRTGDLCVVSVFGAMEVQNIALYYEHPTQEGGFEMNGNYFKTNT